MHLKRQEAAIKLPIPRKGTKYIARALSHIDNSIPIVIAVRDILKLAQTTSEVKRMIHQKLLKINNRPVRNHKESLKLFNLLEADKTYILTLLPTGKFTFEETKEKNARLCKVINKKLIKNNLIQLNLHDGSNLISKENIPIGDSVYINLEGKMKKHISFEKGKEAVVIKGKYLGLKGKIESVHGNLIKIHLNDKSTDLNKSQIIVL